MNIIVGRLRNRLTETGGTLQMALPRTWVGETGAGLRETPADETILSFSTSAPAAQFDVVLRVGPATATS